MRVLYRLAPDDGVADFIGREGIGVGGSERGLRRVPAVRLRDNEVNDRGRRRSSRHDAPPHPAVRGLGPGAACAVEDLRQARRARGRRRPSNASGEPRVAGSGAHHRARRRLFYHDAPPRPQSRCLGPRDTACVVDRLGKRGACRGRLRSSNARVAARRYAPLPASGGASGEPRVAGSDGASPRARPETAHKPRADHFTSKL